MASVTCPHCGATTALEPDHAIQTAMLVSESDHRAKRFANVVVDLLVDKDVGICRCVACNERYVAAYDNYAWRAVWPLAVRSVAEEIPDGVRSAFIEASLALAVDSLGGCLLMNRTTVIRLLRQCNVSSLKELFEMGLISKLLYGQADEVRLWANAVGHEDFDPSALTREVCQELTDYIDSLLQAVYVQPAKLSAHKQKRAEARATQS